MVVSKLDPTRRRSFNAILGVRNQPPAPPNPLVEGIPALRVTLGCSQHLSTATVWSRCEERLTALHYECLAVATRVANGEGRG